MYRGRYVLAAQLVGREAMLLRRTEDSARRRTIHRMGIEYLWLLFQDDGDGPFHECFATLEICMCKCICMYTGQSDSVLIDNRLKKLLLFTMGSGCFRFKAKG